MTIPWGHFGWRLWTLDSAAGGVHEVAGEHKQFLFIEGNFVQHWFGVNPDSSMVIARPASPHN
jgi:hypothetical protein